MTNATPSPKWTLESPLRDFMETAFLPHYKGSPRRIGRKYTDRLVEALATALGRSPTLADLNADVVESLNKLKARSLRESRNRLFVFRRAWRLAFEFGIGTQPHNQGRGVPARGPAYWTKRETVKLMATSKRLGGTFARTMADGTRVRISRAAWFALFIRLSRCTGLSRSQLERAKRGDVTGGGALVAKTLGIHHTKGELKAFPLSKACRKAIAKQRGDADDFILGNVATPDILVAYFRRVVQAAGLRNPDGGYRLTFGNQRRVKRETPRRVEPQPHTLYSCDSPLDEFVRDCYFPQKLDIKSEKTRSHYRVVLKLLGEVLGRRPIIGDLTDANICAMIRVLEDRKLSAPSIYQRQCYLKALANWCSKKQIIPWWVTVPPYQIPEIVPVAWTLAEMNRLFAACARFPGTYFGYSAAGWWQVFHQLLWDCGERTGAMLNIEPDWLNLETGMLVIPGPKRKGGRKAAVYELKPETVDAVRPLIQAARLGNRDRLFFMPGHLATFYNHYTRILKLAGLPSGAKNKPQKVRRSYATHIEAAGGNSTEALMHTSRRITVTSYIDPTIAKRPALNRLLPSLGVDDAKGGGEQ